MSDLGDRAREAMRRMAEEINPQLTLPASVRRRVRWRHGLTLAASTTVLVVSVIGGIAAVDASRHKTLHPEVRTKPAITSPVLSGPTSSLGAAPAVSTAPAACVSGWTVAAKPVSSGATDSLLVASATAYSDIWAVGSRHLVGNQSEALIEHWDGRQWTRVPGADVGGRWATLASVDALAPSDVWAVGTLTGTSNADPRQEPLIEHWNGRQWSRVTGAPGASGVAPRLSGIAAVGPEDLWVLGHDSPAVGGTSISRDLYEHWDGTHWSLFQGPLPVSPGVQLQATQAIAVDRSGDAWAAGGTVRGVGGAGQPAGNLVERWSGSKWVEMPAPPGKNAVGALAVVGPSDVWAVTGLGLSTGAGSYGSTGPSQLVHWNGTSWMVSSSPAHDVSDVVAGGPSDVWAAGDAGARTQLIVVHWDGRQWHAIDARPPVTSIAAVGSLSIAANGTVVGFSSDAPPNPDGSGATRPDKARNYLWINCP
jgi:hypothetical protein